MPRDVQWSAQLQLPTDAELVWLLFCAYMDGHLTADPFAAGVNYAKPFSSIHSLRKPASPIPVQKASNAFYVQMVRRRRCPRRWPLNVSVGGSAACLRTRCQRRTRDHYSAAGTAQSLVHAHSLHRPCRCLQRRATRAPHHRRFRIQSARRNHALTILCSVIMLRGSALRDTD